MIKFNHPVHKEADPLIEEKSRRPGWYKLDNAGVLYSAIQKERYSSVYRFSAVMAEKVDPAALQRAVDKTLPRFPGFQVHMKRGVFWSYFERNEAPGPFVKKDIANPCQPIRVKEDNGWLVRFSTMSTESLWRPFTPFRTAPAP